MEAVSEHGLLAFISFSKVFNRAHFDVLSKEYDVTMVASATRGGLIGTAGLR